MIEQDSLNSRSDDISFVFYLPNLSAYRDRAQLIGHMARKVGRGVLVTSLVDVEPRELGIEDIELVEARKSRRYPGSSAFTASKVVSKILGDGDFNVVHDTFGHLLPLFARERRRRGRVYLTSLYSLAEWDLRNLLWPDYRLRTLTHLNLRTYYSRTLTQLAVIGMSDAVVVQAPGLVGRLAESVGRPGRKIAWLPNNVTISEPRTQQQAPLESQAIQLLLVGGLSVGKGADHLVSLLARARSRGIPLHATAVGSLSPMESSKPVDHSYLRDRIETERVQDDLTYYFRVDRSRLDQFYAESDWLFHVTSLDGSPRVVLEALAIGLPVIGSRHPGVTVLDPGDEFILFADPFDPDTLLDQLVAEKAEKTAHTDRAVRGRNHMMEYHSSEAVSEQYIQLYSRLIVEHERRMRKS